MTEETQNYIQFVRTVYFSREDIRVYSEIDGITVVNSSLDSAMAGDITSSTHNKVIPLHALAKGIGSVIQKGNDKVLLYAPVFEYSSNRDRLPRIIDNHHSCIKIPTLLESISENYIAKFRWTVLNHQRIERNSEERSFYAAANHCLIELDFNPYYHSNENKAAPEEFRYEDIFNPLVIVGVKQEYLFDITPNNIDPKKLCVVISKDFTKNPKHSKVYRAFVKNYLNRLHPDVDIMYANSVKEVCYKQVHIPTPIMTASRLSRLQDKVKLELHEIFKKRQTKKRAKQAGQNTTEDTESTGTSTGEVAETHEADFTETVNTATNTTIADDVIEIISSRSTTATHSISSVYSTLATEAPSLE